MEKIFALLATLMLSMTMMGCSVNSAENAQTYQENVPSRFVILEESSIWRVVADRETRVMYAVSTGRRNGGNLTMLVNSDGTPLLYEGEI